MALRFAILCFFQLCCVLPAHEGFWPLRSLPAETIKAECDVELDEKWTERAMKAAVSLRFPDGGGSGAFVSNRGLLVTNRHVVSDILAAFSTPEINLAKTGFLAKNTDGERRYDGLSVRVLDFMQKMPPAFKAALKDRDGRARAQFLRQAERAQAQQLGQPCQIVELHGGGEYWLYAYKDYADVRLVYAPDEGLGNFGGKQDNFRFPRHELDVAFLRVYENGKPAQTPHYFEWSSEGAGDGQAVFSIGHPGDNSRELPVAYVKYLCAAQFPAHIARFAEQERILSQRMKVAGANVAVLEVAASRASNGRKMFEDTLEILRRPAVLKELEAREKNWRERIGVHPHASRVLGSAYDDSDAACEKLRAIGPAGTLSDFGALRLMGAVGALQSFAQRAATLDAAGVNRMSASIQGFFRQGVYAPPGLDIDEEQAQFEGLLAAIEKLLPENDPLRKAVLNGKSSAEVARAVYRESKLTGADGCCALIEQGAAAINASKDPALEFSRAIAAYKNQPEHQAGRLEQICETSTDTVRRALFSLDPRERAPETNRTVRLTFGRVQSIDAGEHNAAKIDWKTTFRSQQETAEKKKGDAEYVPSPLLKAATDAELNTPLNFVCTADGGPGCSGAPVVDASGKLVGVMFDGNKERVGTLYYYAPVWGGGRSIAVHSAAVLLGLKLAGAAELRAELLGK